MVCPATDIVEAIDWAAVLELSLGLVHMPDLLQPAAATGTVPGLLQHATATGTMPDLLQPATVMPDPERWLQDKPLLMHHNVHGMYR